MSGWFQGPTSARIQGQTTPWRRGEASGLQTSPTSPARHSLGLSTSYSFTGASPRTIAAASVATAIGSAIVSFIARRQGSHPKGVRQWPPRSCPWASDDDVSLCDDARFPLFGFLLSRDVLVGRAAGRRDAYGRTRSGRGLGPRNASASASRAAEGGGRGVLGCERRRRFRLRPLNPRCMRPGALILSAMHLSTFIACA